MHKKTWIFFISAFLVFQICNAAIIARASNDDAANLLNELRQVATDLLMEAFTSYVTMSDQVDAAAQEAKGNVEDAALIQCINDQATNAINLIFAAAVNTTRMSLQPSFSEEQHLISCGGIDEACINSTIGELRALIDWVPGEINTEVLADWSTIYQQVDFIQACGAQIAKIQKLVATTSASDNAKAVLNRLRQVTIDNINLAGLDYTAMSNVVDSIALQMRASGTGLELGNCVNSHAMPAVDLIHSSDLTLVETFLKPIYDAETQLVICGASDTTCINAVITDIQSKIDSTPGAINTEVQMDSQAVDVHVSAMKTC